MRPSTRVRILTVPVLMLLAEAASAQPSQSSQDPGMPPTVTWSVAAGYESFWLRDVARSGVPVDASPVSWEGQGPGVVAHYDRSRPGRLHRFEFSYSSAGGFSLETPVRTIPRSPDDSAVRVGGRYEYRRYPFRDLLMNGLDVGIGIDGRGEYLSFDRHLDPSIEIRTTGTNLGVAVVAAARLRRWSRLDLQAAWANGGTIGRETMRHRADAESTVRAWGGGWLTDLLLSADVRIARRAAIRVSYLGSGQGRFSSHDAYASGRSRLALGVTYAR